MASVTAFIIIGDPHPNDNGISPEWLIELWEGSRATLKLKSLTGSKRSRVIQVATPKAIFKNKSRKSPPYPANKNCGKKMKGNDGNTYESKPNKNNVCSWKKI